jgi:predicted permease
MRAMWSRIVDVILRRRREARLSEEVQTHLDLLADDLMAQGMSPADARLAARKAFGGVDQMKERYRDQRGLPALDALLQDLRYAVRMLRKEPALTMAAVLALGIGIGANAVVFTMVNAFLLRDLPVPRGHEFVAFGTTNIESSRISGVSLAEFDEWRSEVTSATDFVAYRSQPASLGGDGAAAEQVWLLNLSASGFDLVGLSPQLGRTFTADEERAGAAPTLIISDALWKRRYGSDPSILGRTVRLADTTATIIGVMRPGESFPAITDAWRPLAQMPGLPTQPRTTRNLTVLARLKPGATLRTIGAEMAAIGDRNAALHPDTDKAFRPRVETIAEYTNGGWWQIFPALMTVAALVLLIACANTANLLLARAAGRSREIALRASLGATRARIIRQLMIESLALAAAAGTIAWLVSLAGIRFVEYVLRNVSVRPRWTMLAMDLDAWLFLGALCVLTPMVFGLLPAWHLSRTRAAELLKDSGRGSTGRRMHRWTSGLVVLEMALSLVVLAFTGILVRTMVTLRDADRIIDVDHLVTAGITLPASYHTAAQRLAFVDALGGRLRANPAIAGASLASTMPLSGVAPRRLGLPGAPLGTTGSGRDIAVIAVSDGYFNSLGTAVIRGRDFTPSDAAGAPVAIVNRKFADTHFPASDPIGQQIQIADIGKEQDATSLTIVGVSPSVRQAIVTEAVPVVYTPYRGEPLARIDLIVRTIGDSAAIVPSLREALRAVDDSIPLTSPQTTEQMMSVRLFTHNLASGLFIALAAVVLLVSIGGLYVMTAHTVAVRTQEIGVRMAVGASSRDIGWLIGRTAMVMVVVACAAGGVSAYASRNLMKTFVAQAGDTNWPVIAAIAVLLGLVAMAAALVPAVRATRLDPVTALRHE